MKQDLSTEALQSILTKYNDSLHDSKVSTEPVTEPATVATGTKKPRHLRRHSSGCTMLDQLLGDICNTLVTSEEQVLNIWQLLKTLFYREKKVILN